MTPDNSFELMVLSMMAIASDTEHVPAKAMALGLKVNDAGKLQTVEVPLTQRGTTIVMTVTTIPEQSAPVQPIGQVHVPPLHFPIPEQQFGQVEVAMKKSNKVNA